MVVVVMRRGYVRDRAASSADRAICVSSLWLRKRCAHACTVAGVTRRKVIDVGLPLVLAVVAVAEVMTSSDIDAPWPVVAMFALGTTVPLLWRRRAPLLVLVVCLACIVIPDAKYEIGNNASAPFAGTLVAAYASGAYTSRRDGRIAAALAARTVELEHEREEKAKLAVAEERTRIARELHDVVAHNISIMVVQAGAERHAIGDDRPDTSKVLATIEETGRAALAEMRRLLGMLRRSDDELALAPQPSLRYLDDLVEQVREAGMPVDLRIEGERRAIPPGIDLSAYRIVQEALTNALKHAGPAHARVTVRYGDDELDIEIADDGAGPDGEAPAGGHGLVGMRERVALFGGDLASGRRRGGGYAVRARLPLAGDAP